MTKVGTTVYALDMPTAGNPKRTVRVDDDTWADYVKSCAAAGVEPAVLLRTFVMWWSRHPGVTLPKRPEKD